MGDFARVASSAPDEAIATSWHIRNFRGSVSLWYFGGAATPYYRGHNTSRRLSACGLFVSIALYASRAADESLG
jgi:hypothetical protein